MNERNERNELANVSNEFNGTRSSANYDRYNPNVLREFNDLNFGRNNYQSVFNDNNTALSVSQEPNIDYSKVEYYLTIRSSDRDVLVYPSSSNFSIELPKEYKNVYSVELIQAIIPDKNNITSEPYLLLSIDELDTVMDSIDKSVSDSFAMLLLTNPPLVSGSFISIDTRIHENTVLYYKTPKSKLSKMTIKILNTDGDVFEFGGSGTKTKSYQSTFVFKIVQMEKNTNMLNRRNVF
jgi:hypothetical protein